MKKAKYEGKRYFRNYYNAKGKRSFQGKEKERMYNSAKFLM
jgi:hypothetical protein